MTKAEMDQWMSGGKVINYTKMDGDNARLTFESNGSFRFMNLRTNRGSQGTWVVSDHEGKGRLYQHYRDGTTYSIHVTPLEGDDATLYWVEQKGTNAAKISAR